MFGIALGRTLFYDDGERKQIDQIAGNADGLAEATLVTVGDLDRKSVV